MFKKVTAFVVVLAMTAAMWIIPTNASNFTDSLFFNADFNSGSFDDAAGSATGLEWYFDEQTESATSAATPTRVAFKDDADIGRKVLAFKGESALFYTDFDYSKIQSNFTMEAYVKVPTKQPGWGYIAGSYWNANPNAGICFTYGTHSAAGVGANMKFNVIEGNGATSQTPFVGNRVMGEWMHLVYTHDGVNECYYENGVLVGSQPVWQSAIPSVTNEATKAFRIGGYNMVSQFCATMDCAYVRVYSSAAAATDVAALYENRNSDVATEEPTATPTNTPTDEPTEEPTPTPDQNLPVLPDGPDYKVVAEDIPAFKAGDKVDITFKVTDIADPEGILGVDLDIVYDYTLLRPVKNDNGRPVVTSAKSEINSANKGANWDSTTRLDGEDTETPTFVLKLFDDADPYAEEPQTELRIKEDGALWFTISFEAVADAAEGAMVAYTSAADGTDHNVDGIKGTGTYVYVGNSTDEPTDEPTDTPTGTPTDEPTEPSPSATTPAPGGNDNKPGNTVTFDAGLVSLAAVALSSIVAAKKKRF